MKEYVSQKSHFKRETRERKEKSSREAARGLTVSNARLPRLPREESDSLRLGSSKKPNKTKKKFKKSRRTTMHPNFLKVTDEQTDGRWMNMIIEMT